MAESSEIPKIEELEKPETKRHSRRSFIGYLATLAGAASLGGLWGKRSIDNSNSMAKAAPEPTQEKTELTPTPKATKTVAQSQTLDRGKTISPPLEGSAEDWLADPDQFRDYLSEERDGLGERVDAEIAAEKSRDLTVLEQALDRSSSYQKIVEKVIREGDYDRKFLSSRIPSLLPGLIFVESKGKPGTVSDEGAVGLCQIKKRTAQDIAAELGVSEYNLEDPETNIKFSLKYLEGLYRYFPEEGLALWSYHLGMGNMVDAISHYLGRADLTIDNAFTGDPPLVAKLVAEGRINFENLVKSQFVKEQIRVGNFDNDTEHYYPRILAADWLIQYPLQPKAAA